jgi:iron(III) transport system permease protein
MSQSSPRVAAMHLYSLILLLPLLLFMVYPLAHVVIGAFSLDGKLSLHFFSIMLRTEHYRGVLYNSLNIAMAVTLISSVVAYALALSMSRMRLPASSTIHALLLAPLVIPPFVGVLGVRQLFGRFGSLNMALLNWNLIDRPIEWLGPGSAMGIIALQVIHLVPILYLSIRASLDNAHISLEEAAVMCGASKLSVLRRIILPLSLPGWFAGATLVFIGSFTDLGTPLLFEYRNVLSVQIYFMLSDLHENPVGYSFIVSTCVLSIALFSLSKTSVLAGQFAGSGRAREGRAARAVSPPLRLCVLALVLLYALFACIPQLGVVLVALSKEWFMSVVPQRWTFEHFLNVLHHPLTTRSIIISSTLSLAASVCTLALGFGMAYTISRGRSRLRYLFEAFSLVPLAVPGIVFAFGFIGAFSGTIFDNRINPFPLLIVAYAVRRLPAMVRSVCAGLAEASRSLEEAALMSGAGPLMITRRITFPLIRRHLIVGTMLTFAYSMIEVSDSLLLALEQKFYPISKAIYALTGRPDGAEVASALGVVVMCLMLGAFYLSEQIARGGARAKLRGLGIIMTLFLASSHASATPQRDEIIGLTPHWEGIREEFGRAFSEHWRVKTGRQVSFRWLDVGGTSDIVKYVKGQFKQNPTGIGVDLFFGGGSDSFLELERNGHLLPIELSPEVLNAIPKDLAGVPLYSAQRTWFANALSSFGILYNKAAIARLGLPTPTAWADLTQPEYFGLVGAGDPRKSGSMHAMYEIILQGYGWSKGWQVLLQLARNVRNFSSSASPIGKEVALGEIVYGITIDTYAGDIIRQVGSGRLEFILPTDFAAVNGDSIAVLKGAPNASVAAAFVEFLLSEAGQRIWYARKGSPGGPIHSELGKLPVLPSLYGAVEPSGVVRGNPFTLENLLSYDSEAAAKRWSLVNDLFGVFIIDVHDRIVRVSNPQALQSIPIRESDVASLIEDGGWGQDAARRTELLQAWSADARRFIPLTPSLFERFQVLPTLVFGCGLGWLFFRRLRRSRRNF